MSIKDVSVKSVLVERREEDREKEIYPINQKRVKGLQPARTENEAVRAPAEERENLTNGGRK